VAFKVFYLLIGTHWKISWLIRRFLAVAVGEGRVAQDLFKGRHFDQEILSVAFCRHMGVTTRKCQNCPVRENQTWTILGLEREIAPIDRVKDTAGGIPSSFQGEKRPLDCLISIAKQSLSVDCRLHWPCTR
jgi:hypothetical protein